MSLSLGLLSLLLAGLAGAAVWHVTAPRGPSKVVAADGFSRLVPARSMPEFELRTAAGALTRADLTGQWTLVALGFTSCPDICPNALSALAAGVREAEASGAPVEILFVSVDPGRDTPRSLAGYAAHFGPFVRGATANEHALREFARPLGLAFEVGESAGPGGSYPVEHSTSVLVVDPSAEVVALLGGHQLAPRTIAQALQHLMQEARG